MAWETMWEFSTARFRVSWDIMPDYDTDLSFDESGEVRAKLESGDYQCFQSRMLVEFDGRAVGVDYLGASIYDDPADFRDHIGLGAITTRAKARRDLDKAKWEFINRVKYLRSKRGRGYGRAYYERSIAANRERIAQARRDFKWRMESAGKCGSYFKDMISEAIREARQELTRETPYIRRESTQ